MFLVKNTYINVCVQVEISKCILCSTEQSTVSKFKIIVFLLLAQKYLFI